VLLLARKLQAGAAGSGTAFLYSGPAINVLAIILTARVLGLELGVARAVGAILFSVVIGVLMAFIFRHEEASRQQAFAELPVPEVVRPLWKTVFFMASMVVFLVFANWAAPKVPVGFWAAAYRAKWVVAGLALLSTIVSVRMWFDREERAEWYGSTWGYALQVLPLLFGGVLVAGLLLGRPGHEALVPSAWVSSLVGGNSLFANFFASVVAAFMYFATLTEVPPAGAHRGGHGQGPRAGAPVGRAGSLPAEHAGHPEHRGDEEDRRLREPGGGPFNGRRDVVRGLLRLGAFSRLFSYVSSRTIR